MSETRATGEIGQMVDDLAALERRHRALAFADLRRGVLAGDDEAWQRLVEKYSRFVYTVALKLLAGAADREELASRVYARVFERIAERRFRLLWRFQGRCRFTSYLFRVVQSEKKAVFADRGSVLRAESPKEHERADERPTEHPLLDAEALRQAVARALERLTSTDRLVLVLRFRDGLTLREIARAAGFKDTNAAAYGVRRALGRLKVLRELRDERRLGGPELAAVEELLARELLDREVDQGGESSRGEGS